MTNWKLTPTQLTFGYECPACFHATVRDGWKKPYEPFPSVFGMIDRATRNYWNGRQIQEMLPGLPAGTIDTKEYWLKSSSIALPGLADTFSISCKTDCLLRFNDGSFGIVDFKTTQIEKLEEKYVHIYSRQLHLNAWALERPGPSPKVATQPIGSVRTLGLLAYEPIGFSGSGQLEMERKFVPIQRDDGWFECFVREIVCLLGSAVAPPSKPECPWCELRRQIANANPSITTH